VILISPACLQQRGFPCRTPSEARDVYYYWIKEDFVSEGTKLPTQFEFFGPHWSSFNYRNSDLYAVLFCLTVGIFAFQSDGQNSHHQSTKLLVVISTRPLSEEPD